MPVNELPQSAGHFLNKGYSALFIVMHALMDHALSFNTRTLSSGTEQFYLNSYYLMNTL